MLDLRDPVFEQQRQLHQQHMAQLAYQRQAAQQRRPYQPGPPPAMTRSATEIDIKRNKRSQPQHSFDQNLEDLPPSIRRQMVRNEFLFHAIWEKKVMKRQQNQHQLMPLCQSVFFSSPRLSHHRC